MTKLATIRKSKGMSVQKLAEYSKISVGAIHSYEQNKLPIEGCRINTLLSLAEKLQVPFYELFDNEETKRRVCAQLVQGAEPGPGATS